MTLTIEQRKHLQRLERWPFRLWCNASRFNAILAGYERANEVARQRAYYDTLWRVTGYEGEDYRVRMQAGGTWVRATKQQYDQAVTTGAQRSIGVPEVVAPELLQITAA